MPFVWRNGADGRSPCDTTSRRGFGYFERICINIMVENTSQIQPDPQVIKIFIDNFYEMYKDDPRVDILLENTDFGVGGKRDE